MTTEKLGFGLNKTKSWDAYKARKLAGDSCLGMSVLIVTAIILLLFLILFIRFNR